MNKRLGRLAATIGGVGALCAVLGTPASAAPPAGDQHDRAVTGFARLGELNHSGAGGLALVLVRGNQVEVSVFADGLLAKAPHAMHLHAGGHGTCPGGSADADHDGIISTTEGHDAYGMVVTSLTVRGDTSPGSVLAVDRFPDTPYGHLVYRRTVTVPRTVADHIRAGNAVLVVHGIDPDGSGHYDGAAVSDLDPHLPLEATSPALCGAVRIHRG